MALLGSLMGRAIAGAGEAAVDIGNKYLDQQLQQQKAQALAELNRSYAIQTEKDLDAVRNDPARRERMRTESGKDAAATAAAELEASATRANDPRIRQGAIDTATATAKAQSDVQRDETIKSGSDPAYLSAKGKLAAAGESELTRAQASLERLKVGAAQKIDGLRTSIAAAMQAGDTEKEKQLRAQLDVFETRPGKEDKLRSAIENAEKAMGPALKIMADSTADPSAKKEAEETVRQARVRIDQYSKQLGIDNSKTEFPGAPEAGTVKDGFTFKGGDPNKKSNWSPVAKPDARSKTSGSIDERQAAMRSGSAVAPEGQMVEKDWLGPGWSFGGKSYPSEDEARAASGEAGPTPNANTTTATPQQVAKPSLISQYMAKASENSARNNLRGRIYEAQNGGRTLSQEEQRQAAELGIDTRAPIR